MRPSQPLLTSSSVGRGCPGLADLFFARSAARAFSSILTCFSSSSLSFFALRQSPSCLAILAFISARSMSHEFRERS